MDGAGIRNDGWKHAGKLRTELEKYVRSNLQRKEILAFMKRDFGEYAWSLRTLDRRLNHFEIRHINEGRYCARSKGGSGARA